MGEFAAKAAYCGQDAATMVCGLAVHVFTHSHTFLTFDSYLVLFCMQGNIGLSELVVEQKYGRQLILE